MVPGVAVTSESGVGGSGGFRSGNPTIDGPRIPEELRGFPRSQMPRMGPSSLEEMICPSDIVRRETIVLREEKVPAGTWLGGVRLSGAVLASLPVVTSVVSVTYQFRQPAGQMGTEWRYRASSNGIEYFEFPTCTHYDHATVTATIKSKLQFEPALGVAVELFGRGDQEGFCLGSGPNPKRKKVETDDEVSAGTLVVEGGYDEWVTRCKESCRNRCAYIGPICHPYKDCKTVPVVTDERIEYRNELRLMPRWASSGDGSGLVFTANTRFETNMKDREDFGGFYASDPEKGIPFQFKQGLDRQWVRGNDEQLDTSFEVVVMTGPADIALSVYNLLVQGTPGA